MLVGTSEATLQYLLGGIGKLGGVSSEQLLTKVAGIDNAILRVAAAAGVKIGSEVTEEELQLFLEPLYRTLVFGEDYSAPAMEEILYTALLTAITTTIVEGGDIASYSSKDIEALVEQSKDQIEEEGEKDLQSGEMPDDAHLEVMGLNDPTARGIMAIYEMNTTDQGSGTWNGTASPIDTITKSINGARITEPESPAAEAHAERYYGLVRSMTTDVTRIAENTGYSEDVIRRIKDFIFMDKHNLGGTEPSCFDPSFAMAQSWQRLIEGIPEPHDLTMLEHEILESELMAAGMSQYDAHIEASKKYDYAKESDAYYGSFGQH